MDKPLDKQGWLTYIYNNQHRIGVLVGLKQVYEDLLTCNTLDESEKAFKEAYEEYLEEHGSMRR